MTAIPHAARALTSALGRFEHASQRQFEAATGAGAEDLGPSLVDQLQARMQFRAGVAVVRVADATMQELLKIQGAQRR